MKVTDVLLAFRTALIGAAAAMDAVALPWRRPDAYDQWDNIATVLYENIVGYTLAWVLPEEEQGEFRLLPYDSLVVSYSGYSVIETISQDHANASGTLIFHAFRTEVEPFDALEAVRIDDNGRRMSDEFETMSLAGVRFRLRLVRGWASPEIWEDVPDDSLIS